MTTEVSLYLPGQPANMTVSLKVTVAGVSKQEAYRMAFNHIKDLTGISPEVENVIITDPIHDSMDHDPMDHKEPLKSRWNSPEAEPRYRLKG